MTPITKKFLKQVYFSSLFLLCLTLACLALVDFRHGNIIHMSIVSYPLSNFIDEYIEVILIYNYIIYVLIKAAIVFLFYTLIYFLISRIEIILIFCSVIFVFLAYMFFDFTWHDYPFNKKLRDHANDVLVGGRPTIYTVRTNYYSKLVFDDQEICIMTLWNIVDKENKNLYVEFPTYNADNNFLQEIEKQKLKTDKMPFPIVSAKDLKCPEYERFFGEDVKDVSDLVKKAVAGDKEAAYKLIEHPKFAEKYFFMDKQQLKSRKNYWSHKYFHDME